MAGLVDWNNLPQEILLNILSYLHKLDSPYYFDVNNDLAQVALVCRSWSAPASDTISKHLHISWRPSTYSKLLSNNNFSLDSISSFTAHGASEESEWIKAWNATARGIAAREEYTARARRAGTLDQPGFDLILEEATKLAARAERLALGDGAWTTPLRPRHGSDRTTPIFITNLWDLVAKMTGPAANDYLNLPPNLATIRHLQLTDIMEWDYPMNIELKIIEACTSLESLVISFSDLHAEHPTLQPHRVLRVLPTTIKDLSIKCHNPLLLNWCINDQVEDEDSFARDMVDVFTRLSNLRSLSFGDGIEVGGFDTFLKSLRYSRITHLRAGEWLDPVSTAHFLPDTLEFISLRLCMHFRTEGTLEELEKAKKDGAFLRSFIVSMFKNLEVGVWKQKLKNLKTIVVRRCDRDGHGGDAELRRLVLVELPPCFDFSKELGIRVFVTQDDIWPGLL
ncbi:hypothetical protein T439DRAFT_351784 [Meredithblackwellia eburnea MCA 4105]